MQQVVTGAQVGQRHDLLDFRPGRVEAPQNGLELVLLVVGGLRRIVQLQQGLDFVDADLALHRGPVALLGLEDVLAVAGQVDTDMGAAEIEPRDVREEILEVGIVDLLAVQQRGAVLEDVGAMADSVGAQVHLAFHQHQQRRLEAGFALGLHLDADLLELALAVFVGVLFGVVASAAAHHDVELRIDVEIGELRPAPVSYTHLDVYKRQVLFGVVASAAAHHDVELRIDVEIGELRPALIALQIAPVVDLQERTVLLAHVGLLQFAPRMGDAVDDQRRGVLFGPAHRLQQVDERAFLGDHQRDAGGLEVGDQPVRAGFGIEEGDRLAGVADAAFLEMLDQADHGHGGGLGLAGALLAHDAHLEEGRRR